jgi:predicted protein tyrosine phosphatase
MPAMTQSPPESLALDPPAPAGIEDVPRPVADCYWVVPRRLLAGAYPGSRSPLHAEERVQRFVEAGVTCFVDLTAVGETVDYAALLPAQGPAGRAIEHLREAIVDHGVPADRATMQRILATIDRALATGHVVYVHCRAGIGRSATAVGCWLAERCGSGEQALAELERLWPQASQSRRYPLVPETPEQEAYIRTWIPGAGTAP